MVGGPGGAGGIPRPSTASETALVSKTAREQVSKTIVMLRYAFLQLLILAETDQ